jgi:hypothetical protein
VYGEAQGGLAEACAEWGLPLHRFAWQEGMRRVGLRRAALYLVRPDGYVALAAPDAGPEPLRDYFNEHGDVGQQRGQVIHAG